MLSITNGVGRYGHAASRTVVPVGVGNATLVGALPVRDVAGVVTADGVVTGGLPGVVTADEGVTADDGGLAASEDGGAGGER